MCFKRKNETSRLVSVESVQEQQELHRAGQYMPVGISSMKGNTTQFKLS